MNAASDERLLYCEILGRILNRQGSLASYLNREARERTTLNYALLQEYCYGVCRWYHKLDFWAGLLLDKPLRGKDRDLHCLILLGLYQLFYMRTPAHAAVNESVNAAARLNKGWARGLVNAVLRKAQRSQAWLEQQAEADYAHLYSHPDWLLQAIKHDWPRDYREILEANNARAPMTLRVNLGRVTRQQYLGQLSEAGIAARAGLLSPTAVALSQPREVGALPGFDDGTVSVQDEASQLLPGLLELKPGLRVLDACAAPGGKSCALLEAEPGLRLRCLDNDPARLPRLRENLDRCGLRAEVDCGDITRETGGIYDLIVLDAPCSATGVIRRHPDIKLLRTPEEVQTLRRSQAALLDAAWKQLVPGGSLLYSTCSVLDSENSEQIAAFVARINAAGGTIAEVPLEIPSARRRGFGSQLAPVAGENDGFYYALLRK